MENNRKLQSHFGNSSKNQNSICHRIRTKEHSIIKTRKKQIADKWKWGKS